MARPLAIVGVIAIVGGGAAIGFAVTRKAAPGMTPAQGAAMTRAVDMLDGDINAKHAAIKSRADSLADVEVVRRASVLDRETAVDMVEKGSELKFKLSPGEVIEIGQITKATGKPQALVVQPAGATASVHDGKPGSYAELAGQQMVITEVAKIEPLANAEPALVAQSAGSR